MKKLLLIVVALFTIIQINAQNKCLEFDGTNDLVHVSDNNTLDLTATGTLETWIYLDAYEDYAGIIHKGDNLSFDDEAYSLQMGGNQYIQGSDNTNVVLAIFDNSSYETIYSDLSLSIGIWYHIAAVWNSDSMYLYINGILDASIANSISSRVTSGGLNIGTQLFNSYNTLNFHGKIDEVRIWNVDRTKTQIIENMCQTLEGNETGLVAYYQMNEPSGTNVPDITDNDNDGTANNMTDTDWVTSAAFNTWLNVANTSWTTTTNWSMGSVPVLTDNVGIPDHGGSHPILTTDINCNNLVVRDGVTLECNSGSHTIHGNAFNIGTTNINANTDLTITGSLYMLFGSSLNIKPLAYLTIDQNLKNSGFLLGGTVTVESENSGTGSLIVNGTPTGDVTMQRYIAAATWGTWNDGWHQISSPVADYPIQDNFTVTTPEDYDFYAWSEPHNLWINFKLGNTPTFETVNGSVNFELGHGYLVAYKDASTKDFTGTINVSDVSISNLDVSGLVNYYSWHLLGNPFTSALTWDLSVDWQKINIGGVAKIWNRVNKSYTAINNNDPIPATNGFMVQALADAASLTIPASKRVHSSQAFYKNSDYPIIKLKANNIDNPSAQESEIRFNPESTLEWDKEFDSDFLSGYAPFFYSHIGNRAMAVNSMPDVEETTTIPFTFIKNEGLNFSIEMYEVENMEMDTWLFDEKLNKDHNLTENPIYIFTAFEQDDPERFVIHFSPLGVEEPASTQELIQIWSSNNSINILNTNNYVGDINVVNLFGQTILSTKLNGEKNQKISINAPSGYYIINTITQKGVVNKKLYLK